MFLQKEFNELDSYFRDHEKQSNEISAKGVDWHIDHSLKVIISICKLLKKSDPTQYKKKFNVSWSYIKTRNSIPRGVGRSPKAVIPPDSISKESIQAQMEDAQSLIMSLNSLPANSFFDHPYFGLLNLKNSQKFLKLHTAHHLKIIRDIVEDLR